MYAPVKMAFKRFITEKFFGIKIFYESVFLKLLIRSYKSDKSLRFQVERLEMRLNDEF